MLFNWIDAISTREDLIESVSPVKGADWIPGPAVDTQNKCYNRLLVSQDRHEIYITFARYNPQYAEYLTNKKGKRDGFLVMESYGPWHINNHENMRYLGQVIVTLTMLASDAA